MIEALIGLAMIISAPLLAFYWWIKQIEKKDD